MGLGFGSMDISIHALLAESDLPSSHSFTARAGISIHALLAESDFPPLLLRSIHEISIHALLAESDRKRNAAVTRPKRISIHALLAESDVHHKQHITPHNVFLSTLSLRRATSALQSLAGPGRYFYPRSPCGERPPRMISSIRSISISIHALLAESDSFRDQFTYSLSIFLSTLSLRRATRYCVTIRAAV